MTKKIHLIGGAPLSGKTYTARKLSKQLVIPWISTDDIRTFMKAQSNPQTKPDLFYDELDTVDFFEKYNTAELIFQNELKQCIEVQSGITQFIEAVQEWDEFILEGHALTPKYNAFLKEYFNQYNFQIEFCKLPDIDTLESRLQTRGLWDTPDKYDINKYKELELGWIKLFDEYIQNELKTVC